jgi:hypothetical protein
MIYPSGTAFKKADEDKTTRSYLSGFRVIDFELGKFDGEYRNSHRWIQYLQDKLDSISVSMIFDPAYPLNPRPDRDYALQEMEVTREREMSDLFGAVFNQWEQLPLVAPALAQGRVVHALPEGQAKQAALVQHVQLLTALQAVHPRPFMAPFVSLFLPLHSERIKSYEKKALKEKVDADKSLAFSRISWEKLFRLRCLQLGMIQLFLHC